ncbi:MAG: hypothetical protein KAR40_07075 [Candidatus Sabulitectum sp.]|nr:hypothetical protein [Candidatus Sabulitectum sp.]
MITVFMICATLFSTAEIISVTNAPEDDGSLLLVEFDGVMETPDNLIGLLVQRREPDSEEVIWETVIAEALPLESTEIMDGYDPDYPISPMTSYQYRTVVLTADGDSLHSDIFTGAELARGEWFSPSEMPTMIGSALFLGLIFFYFHKAKRGAEFYLRPIAGIEAIDEAIGRATEMGKPILYVPGLSTISDVATIASITILGRVAKKVAEYGTPLLVPNCDPIVFTVCEETVRQGYLEAGRPDAYDNDSVFFLTQSQFAYVAGVNGIMMREKPATNFYLGMFWAESLILAETGALSGAIQIAGTDAVTQLPFFITTCDYTLIGEELYAASAYLGREPKQLGSIKGQDSCKAVMMSFIALGIVLSIIYAITGNESVMFLSRFISL